MARKTTRKTAARKTRRKPTRRVTKFDALAASAAQSFAHQHTVTVNSRRRVLEFEGSETDRAIIALSSALANKRNRRKEIDAMLRGLEAVVNKR